MDSIYYVLIIIGISFGLIVLYIILRSMKVIGEIPILSDIIDPILSSGSKLQAIAWHDKPKGKNKYYNQSVTEENVVEAYYEGELPHEMPTEIQNNLNREMVKKFGEDYDLVPSEHDDYCKYRTIGYNRRTGIITENVSVEPKGKDGYGDFHIKYYLKTGNVAVGDGYSPDAGKRRIILER